jgi:hypothetical protein
MPARPTPFSFMSPDEMIRHALSDGYKGEFSQELYSAFCSGYPIENLQPLLTSNSINAVRTGAYLVYELGGLARPLVREIEALLDNPEPQIKSDAIIALRDCATTKANASALGKIILLLGDADSFVQRGVMAFVHACRLSQLELGTAEANKISPDSVFGVLAEAIKRPVSRDTIKALIEHPEPIAKRFGVGLAARPRDVVDLDFLKIAESWNDAEALEFLGFVWKHPFPKDAAFARVIE